MSDTKIEWTDTTWNPTTGCDRVSPGCDHCYALTLARRLKAMGSAKYQRDGDPRTSGPGFGLSVHSDTLTDPLSWQKPRKVFVNSMSDLFHKEVSDEFIARALAVIAATPRHTYQLLTKRHARMRAFLSRPELRGWVEELVGEACDGADFDISFTWPLSNLWVGVSVEDQKAANLRVPALLATPAAVRWLSCEPLLGPVDLTHVADKGASVIEFDALGKRYGIPGAWQAESAARVGWVVVGGESGPGARPMHPSWARELRDQCVSAGVPFLFKQWGEYGLLPRGWREEGPWPHDPGVTVANDGTVYQPGDLTYEPEGPRYREAVAKNHGRAELIGMHRVGKKEAGRELDGRTWDEFPAGAA